MDINNLTPEIKEQLRKQFEAEQQAESVKREGDIEALKTMQDELCAHWLLTMFSFSKEQAKLVDSVFADASPLIKLKMELYKSKAKQNSHTFTARDGSGSITVGYNTVIGFDGTSDIGVHKIQTYLSSLSQDDSNRVKIDKILNVLLQRNKKGELNPTRIMDLSNLKAEIDDATFSEGVDIVVAAQQKSFTSSYVEGWILQTNEDEKQVKLQFRITAK